MSSNSSVNARATASANIKLRASCNACHESKVRCTQTKPTCVRCERNGLVCVYGLSRRTHKDAPRILTPSRRSLSAGSRGLPAQQQQEQVKECPITPRMLEMPPIINFLEEQSISAFNCTSETLANSDILAVTHDNDSGQDSLTGFPLVTDGSENNAEGSRWITGSVADQFFAGRVEDGPWVGIDFQAPLLQASPNVQGKPQQHLQSHQDQDQDQDQDMQEPPLGPGESECGCSSEAVPVLLRMSPLFNRRTNQQLPFDMELSQIKRAIMSCEVSVKCQLHAADPNIAMVMGVLLGGIIDGFEKLLANDDRISGDDNNPQSSSPTPEATKSSNTQGQATSKSSGGKPTCAEKDKMMTESRLSWGVLQLEDDDEADLRLRLCVLYFRRLETLLKHFSQSIRFLRDAQQGQEAAPRSSAAHVMACDYMRIWLEQKAEIVRLCLSRRHME